MVDQVRYIQTHNGGSSKLCTDTPWWIKPIILYIIYKEKYKKCNAWSPVVGLFPIRTIAKKAYMKKKIFLFCKKNNKFYIFRK